MIFLRLRGVFFKTEPYIQTNFVTLNFTKRCSKIYSLKSLLILKLFWAFILLCWFYLMYLISDNFRDDFFFRDNFNIANYWIRRKFILTVFNKENFLDSKKKKKEDWRKLKTFLISSPISQILWQTKNSDKQYVWRSLFSTKLFGSTSTITQA